MVLTNNYYICTIFTHLKNEEILYGDISFLFESDGLSSRDTEQGIATPRVLQYHLGTL
jgi:hypothetical protein